MRPFDEMKAYVRFTDEDARLLEDFWPHVQPRTREIADQFYDRILEFETARSVFSGPDQVRRLKQTLQQWMEELLRGPHDEAYYQRRRRIGEVHVRVHLPHRYMFTAMTLVQENLAAIAREVYDGERAHRTIDAVRRITMIDLAIMTGTFLTSHTRAQLRDAAGVMLAHLPAAAFLVDRGGRVVACTDVARRLVESEPVGAPLVTVLPAALVEAADLERRLTEALQEGRTSTVARADARFGDEVRSFGLDVAPIAHEAFGAVVHVDEITVMVKSEAARRRDEALVQLGSMSAAVAHELRNPLAGISGAVQVLAGSFPEEDRRRAIMAKVRDQIGRLDRMVRDLLAFSRPPDAHLARVDLADVADVVCDLVRRDVPPLVRIVRQGEGCALGDADLIHRILLNLIQNAAGALPDGCGEVRVVVSEGEVVVADSGPGVPPELRGRIFEPFFTTKTSGTGLGLAICVNAAEAMGARLELMPSGPLPGAAFRLVLEPCT